MDVAAAQIPGLVVFTPTPHLDERGFFSRTFDAELARTVGIDPDAFVQGQPLALRARRCAGPARPAGRR
ncbi:dTDP-4-dehydrorhamnose 3,5-epimerase family protein [Nocardioides sp. B-3]|uniref:dTDP-4-dehydrorhamnose 3,5-epimerase family protein n=1 Tax=Nocardioides sp. B-3 TaxID=2895565 RepID=UPI002152AE10|nr:dTDP-4-dehydrorhamnose 3,5-epimerase family protein [Nocardioides sp. B-3]UUZ60407.1 dTDP-4-dehydrorhamnose 3,5-epimerase family protein [Nocardioides sp. B-3]